MQKLFSVISTIIICCSLQAQTVQTLPDTVLRFEKKIEGRFQYLNADILGNIYVINSAGQLRKLSAAGDSLAAYNEIRKYGQPTRIDVSNPMKILVYYKPYGIIVTLDRLLTFRNSINLRSKQLLSVSSVATAYDNQIWIFDGADQKIKKIDDNGDVITEGQDLRLLTDELPSSPELLDDENRLFLYDENKGFYVFDALGGYINLLPFKGWKHVALSGNSLIGFENNRLTGYQLRSFQSSSLQLPEWPDDVRSIKICNGRLYLLRSSGIETYSIVR